MPHACDANIQEVGTAGTQVQGQTRLFPKGLILVGGGRVEREKGRRGKEQDLHVGNPCVTLEHVSVAIFVTCLTFS